jgi:hypothetical protein
MSRMRLIFEGDGGSVSIGICGICGDTSFGGGKFYEGTV